MPRNVNTEWTDAERRADTTGLTLLVWTLGSLLLLLALLSGALLSNADENEPGGVSVAALDIGGDPIYSGPPSMGLLDPAPTVRPSEETPRSDGTLCPAGRERAFSPCLLLYAPKQSPPVSSQG